MNFDNLKPEQLRKQARDFETGWQALVELRGETRYVELFDRRRLTYGRMFLPSEVMFVWAQTTERDDPGRWLPGNDNDNFGAWEPIVSQVER